MKDKTSIWYVQPTNEPDRQSSPRVLAQSAKAMDIKPTVYYLGMSLTVLKPGEAEKMKLGTFPSVREMLDKTLGMGIPVLVWEASKQMLGWETVDLIDGVEIVGAATLNDLALDAGAVSYTHLTLPTNREV